MTSTWQSGVYTDTQTQAAMNAFGTWRNQAIQMATIFPDSDTWAEFTTNNWPYNQFDGAPYNVAIAVPMIPKTGGPYSITDGANGVYDSHWSDFATTLMANGLGNAILRLGWEFNGTWQPWVASDSIVTEWVAYWKVIVGKIREIAPNVKFCWNVNRGVTSGQTNPLSCFPGIAYVDIIGVDSYDTFPPCKSDSSGWPMQLGGNGLGTGTDCQGLIDWLLYAKSLNLKFAIPEWGNVTPGSTDGLLWGAVNVGGDDPEYVTQMLTFFAAHSTTMEWESNFQGASTGGIYQPTTSVPNSATTYSAAY